MSYIGVDQLVRYRLNAKLKVPRPVHIQQKEAAVEGFQKTRTTSTADSKSELRQSGTISTSSILVSG